MLCLGGMSLLNRGVRRNGGSLLGVHGIRKCAINWPTHIYINAGLNPVCHLLALLGAHPILHVSRIRVQIIR
jgi:hypothetical protein